MIVLSKFGPRIAIVVFSLLGAYPPALAASDQITLSGTQLMRGGQPWIPKGVVVTGMVAPDNALLPGYKAAHQHYGLGELQAIKAYGADLLRFQVSQAGNDPQSSIYSSGYADEVKQAVALARSNGLAVIVSMQAERPSGLDQKGMPSDATQRAWKTLAPLFVGDPGIMLELFNEPAPFGPTPHDWAGWLATTQPLVEEVRQMGSHNVLLADGLRWAHTVSGAPPLKDPMQQVVYAEHPYFSPDDRTRANWDRNFGTFSATHPVLVTEWNAWSGNFCFAGLPATAGDFLAYLRQKRIGLVAWAFDVQGTLISGYDWKPTTLDGGSFRCGKGQKFGAGDLVHSYFSGMPLSSN